MRPISISQELRYLINLRDEAAKWENLPEGTDPVHYEVDQRLDAILSQMEANMDGTVDMPPESVHDNSPMTARERRLEQNRIRSIEYRKTHKKVTDPVTGKRRWVKISDDDYDPCALARNQPILPDGPT